MHTRIRAAAEQVGAILVRREASLAIVIGVPPGGERGDGGWGVRMAMCREYVYALGIGDGVPLGGRGAVSNTCVGYVSVR